ncbi:MAG: Hpt domain-containing protein [Giesbergeria sp.]|uniref:hybrid sensor histidine kinase/response regulator n=1 Tax=Giesbergeria sp. TaxID=2818473 RepID=UPI0026380D53|nr:Hpt domain-containing protein [Giesbergeria sp.]MDD2609677.1 Hpt domain-containing protein [Giesbergeria sp.]
MSIEANQAPATEVSQGEQDLGPLAWVLEELRKSLDGAVKSLRRFVHDAQTAQTSDLAALDASSLRMARQQLHQASGALEMIGMEPPALLLRAMEAAVLRYVQRPELCTEEAAASLERASFALSEYLDTILAGKNVSAVALFPQYRDVQTLAGAERSHPADLWPVERRLREPATAVEVAPITYGPEARARLDQAVLKIVKTGSPEAARDLGKLCLELAAGVTDKPVRTFWKIGAAFFEAFAHSLFAPDVYAKRAASRVLMQYATLAKGDTTLTDRLVQDLLFFCAQAKPSPASQTPALEAVRQTFALQRFTPVDYETRRFGRFDPAVLAQARKRIATATETWSSLAGGDRNKLKPAADQFSLVCDSLRKLHPSSEALAQALSKVVEGTLRSGEPPPPALAMEVATSVLYLQAAFEELDSAEEHMSQRAKRLAERLDQVRMGAEPDPLEHWMEDLYRRVSDHQTMGSVVDELRIALGEAERAMDQFFRKPDDTSPLKGVPNQLAQMRGVLSVLGLDQASLAVVRMRDTIERLLLKEVQTPQERSQSFEKLGNSLGALGFLIDMLSYQRTLARKLFVYDEALGELRSLMGRARTRADDEEEEATEKIEARAAQALPEVAPKAPVAAAAPPAAVVPPPSAPSAAPVVAAAPPSPVATPAPSPAPAAAPTPAVATPATPAAPAPALPTTVVRPTLDLDDELLDIFLEEAKEVVGNGLAAVATLEENPGDLSEQTTLRRAFHTLKGSSRMVGLNDFGEAAWSMEQLLNAWLAEQKPAQPPLLQLSGDALRAFDRWADDIAKGQFDGWQVAPFQVSADALRLEHKVVPLNLSAAATASAIPAAAAPTPAVAVPPPAVEPTLQAPAWPDLSLTMPQAAAGAGAAPLEWANTEPAGLSLAPAPAPSLPEMVAEEIDFSQFSVTLDSATPTAAQIEAEAQAKAAAEAEARAKAEAEAQARAEAEARAKEEAEAQARAEAEALAKAEAEAQARAEAEAQAKAEAEAQARAEAEARAKAEAEAQARAEAEALAKAEAEAQARAEAEARAKAAAEAQARAEAEALAKAEAEAQARAEAEARAKAEAEAQARAEAEALAKAEAEAQARAEAEARAKAEAEAQARAEAEARAKEEAEAQARAEAEARAKEEAEAQARAEAEARAKEEAEAQARAEAEARAKEEAEAQARAEAEARAKEEAEAQARAEAEALAKAAAEEQARAEAEALAKAEAEAQARAEAEALAKAEAEAQARAEAEAIAKAEAEAEAQARAEAEAIAKAEAEAQARAEAEALAQAAAEEQARAEAEAIAKAEAEAQARAEAEAIAKAEAEEQARIEEEEQVQRIGSLRIGTALYNVYVSEAQEWVRRLNRSLQDWAQALQEPVSDTAVALAHSLAGSSATVGFMALSETARLLEHTLLHVQPQHHGEPEQAQVFLAAAQDIDYLLQQFAEGVLVTANVQVQEDLRHILQTEVITTLSPPLEDTLAALAELEEQEEARAAQAQAQAAAEAAQHHAHSLAPAAPAPFATPAPAPASDEEGSFELSLEEELAAMEAEAVAASTAAITPMAEPTWSAPEAIEPPAPAPAPVTQAPPASPPAAQAAPDNDQQVDAAIANAMALDTEHDDDIDVLDMIDPDLFPIFEEEAQELLPRLGASLRQWSARPANLAARSELLRALHTLKGSARLAGAMRLGEMAHRLESAIEELDVDTVTSEQIDPMLARLDSLQANFDVLRVISAQGPAEPVVVEAPKSSNATASAPVGATDGSPSTSADGASSSSAQHPLLAAIPARLQTIKAAAPSRAASQQSVRVRAQLLDRLVNQAGEVMISRSRLESHVGQIKTSLADLSVNLDKLRQQLRDIELQSESQMQSRLAQTKEMAAGFDPLEFDRFTRVQELTRMMAESVNDVATVQRNLQRSMVGAEDELIAQGRQARELQRDLLRTRMLEFEGISERLYAVVRLASKEMGKQIKLDITGGSIEMDRGVLDRMTPAFEHLLRNCVAHGIESPEQRQAAGKPTIGTIAVHLRHEGNDVSVEFRDDGAGLNLPRILAKAQEQGLVAPGAQITDAEAANLIFMPGFTTAASLSGIAGRGIGMDVVRSEIKALGGRIETSTEAGKGTSFRMVLPLTTAVTQVVMLRAGNLSFGVPANLVEVVRRTPIADLEQAYQSGQFDVAGEKVPFFWAGGLLQATLHSEEHQGKNRPVVVFRSASQRVALHVDEVLGNQEVVVKNLGPQLARLPGLAGMSVLASGAVVLIYNPVALVTVYGERVRAALQAVSPAVQAGVATATASAKPAAMTAAPQVPLVLVVDDSITVRRVTQRLLQREGYRVSLAADGLQALERLQEERPTVVLSDIEMPRMDGFDLARNIRMDEKLQGLPIIMITSRIAQKHQEHAMELGVNHYLGKPYSDEELMSLVKHYAQLAAAQAEAVEQAT